MHYLIRVKCEECDGQGYYVIGVGNDPDAKVFDCESCRQLGWVEFEEEYCSIVTAEDEHPTAISIATIQNSG